MPSPSVAWRWDRTVVIIAGPRAASSRRGSCSLSVSRYRVSWIDTITDGIELDAAREVARPRLVTCRFVAHG